MKSGEDFLAALPAEEFETFETELREALINAAGKARELGLEGGRFPLQQWIDRRLGGEIRTSDDTENQCEIALIKPGLEEGGSGDEEAAAFFQSLSDDSFSQEEEQLRESIFDFLAGWSSPEFAKLSDLRSDARVQAAIRALLPSSVLLEKWMERRIGGEIEIHQDKQGRDVIQVTQEARKIVAERMKAQESAPRAPAPPPPPPPQPPAPGGKGGKPGFAPKGAKGGKAPHVSKEQWLQSLPADELTGDEVELRQALLDWLDTWRPGKGKGGGKAPLVIDVLHDNRLSPLRTKLLPYNVPLQEWVEARIGGEIELRSNQKGQLELVKRSPEEEPEPEQEQEQEQEQDAASVLDALPDDALTDEELELRTAVLELLATRPRAAVRSISQHPTVFAAKKKFLPSEVPLRDWIDRRIGGEVEVTEDERLVLRAAEEEAPPAREAKGKGWEKGKAKAQNGERPQDAARAAESFFESLPADTLTDGEEELRDAILTFMEGWTAEERPSLSRLTMDAGVKRRRAFLPATLSLKEWVERRLGGELEILPNSKGSLSIGIRGDPDPGPEPETAKRSQEAEWGQGPGKTRKLGT